MAATAERTHPTPVPNGCSAGAVAAGRWLPSAARHDTEEPVDYTGHVEPDGEWQDRVDGPVRVRKLSVEEMDNNVYVVSCTATGEALLVDAAARPERLREALADVSPVAVVQTHGHWDHVRAWEALAEDPGLPVWGHPGDAELFPAPLDRELVGGEVLQVGELEVRVIHTPGHTPGSLHYLVAGRRASAPVHRRQPLPGRPGQHLGRPREVRRAHARGWRARCSGRCPTRRGSTPATATTPRSARNGHRCRTGGNAAGDRPQRVIERRRSGAASANTATVMSASTPSSGRTSSTVPPRRTTSAKAS